MFQNRLFIYFQNCGCDEKFSLSWNYFFLDLIKKILDADREPDPIQLSLEQNN